MAGLDPIGNIASRCDQLRGIKLLAVFFSGSSWFDGTWFDSPGFITDEPS